MDESTRERSGTGETNRRPTRRAVLRGAGAVGLASTGLIAATSGTTAQWWSSGVETFDIGSQSTVTELPSSDEDELVVYLHGGGVGDSADEQGQDIEDGLADEGFETTVVAGVFEETEAGFGDATSPPGNHLADLIEDYMDSGGTVHVVGWSMGGMITMQTLNAMSSGYVVDSGATFGTGTPNDDVCEGGTYHEGIANHAEEFCVITSDDDSAVNEVNGTETRCGDEYGNGPAPSNLEQIDVTSDVDSHLGYLDSSLFYEELADCFEESATDDTGGTDGDSGSGGWW